MSFPEALLRKATGRERCWTAAAVYRLALREDDVWAAQRDFRPASARILPSDAYRNGKANDERFTGEIL